MKKVLIKKERKAMVDGKLRVISSFEKHLINPTVDFHFRLGRIKKEELSKKGPHKIVMGSDKVVLFDASFIDEYKSLKRSAQIITLKDVGCIITSCGITTKSKIIEAGVGSGALTCYLAAICKKIVSYDVDSRSLSTARENIKNFGYKNSTIKEASIYDVKKITEKNFDVLVLDVPEPWQAIATASKVLAVGGFVASYSPHIMQVQEFVKALPDSFMVDKVVEIIEREWAVDSLRSRPATKDHGHTGFIVIARKIE